MKTGFDSKSGCIISSIKSIRYDANLALIRHASNKTDSGKKPVLFFHGATVPTLMTSAYRIDGLSWFDALATTDRPVYGLDLLGYGESDQYPGVDDSLPDDPRKFGTAPSLIDEVDAVVDLIRSENSVDSIHIIAISRGAIPAGYYSTYHPETVSSLTLHGPITRQMGLGSAVIQKYFGTPTLPEISHFSVSAHDRFILLRDDRPAGTTSPLEEYFVHNWIHDYSQRVYGDRNSINKPIKTPMGFAVDISNAWDDLYFDETRLVMPTFIIRGEWDEVLTPSVSCQAFFEKIPGDKKQYLQLPEATHSMMYEKCRHVLYRQIKLFLADYD